MDSRAESSPQFGNRNANFNGEARRRSGIDAGRVGQSKRPQETGPADGTTTLRRLDTAAKEGKGRIRVAVVEDEPEMRLIVQTFLEQTSACTCVGSFSNAVDALAMIPQLNPDVVFMDIGMPSLNGIECARRLKQAAHHIRIIMLTGLHDESFIRQSLEAGADAYLLKPITADQCLATIKFALGREDAGLLLTMRERQVMECLADGLLYKEIADKLNMSYSGVRKHQQKIFLKLHATNRSEAIHKWHQLGGNE